MADKTQIEWADATWNLATGCSKVSPGCAKCYIERTMPFRTAHRRFDRSGQIPLIFHSDRLEQPRHWRRGRRIFVNSLTDTFHPDFTDASLDEIFATILLTPQHRYMVLTKRADRLEQYFTTSVDEDGRPARQRIGLAAFGLVMDWHQAGQVGTMPNTKNALIINGISHDLDGAETDQSNGEGYLQTWPIPNLELGVSVENNRFRSRIGHLIRTPAAVRFVSAEPLLEALDLTVDEPLLGRGREDQLLPGIDQVIIGGESLPMRRRARPFDILWALDLIQQCAEAEIACFVKQLGSNPFCSNVNVLDIEWDTIDERSGPSTDGHAAGFYLRLKDQKGGDWNEWPEELRVRQHAIEMPAFSDSRKP